MNTKAILIKDQETISILNIVKGLVIQNNPNLKITDEKILKIVLEEYKNGRTNYK